MSQQRITLKNPTGWFPAGREVSRAMAVLSDGAFKVYMHVCLTADRSTGRTKIVHGDLATALKKSRRSIVTHLEELRKHQICSIEAARNQHAAGNIEVCDSFWPYVKCRSNPDRDKTLDSYVEAIRQSLAARKWLLCRMRHSTHNAEWRTMPHAFGHRSLERLGWRSARVWPRSSFGIVR